MACSPERDEEQAAEAISHPDYFPQSIMIVTAATTPIAKHT
jgi:hypothetical protein